MRFTEWIHLLLSVNFRIPGYLNTVATFLRENDSIKSEQLHSKYQNLTIIGYNPLSFKRGVARLG